MEMTKRLWVSARLLEAVVAGRPIQRPLADELAALHARTQPFPERMHIVEIEPAVGADGEPGVVLVYRLSGGL